MKGYETLVEKYGRQADYYDHRWNLQWGQATLRAGLETVPWTQLARVLDVGCGTGALEQALEQAGGSPNGLPRLVVGADLSLPMLQLASKKVNANGRVSWANAPAEQLPFATGSFDGLICNNSFHYYRDAKPVLDEFRRVLKPGGQLVVVDWCKDFWGCKFGYWGLLLGHWTHIHRYSLSHVYGLKEFEKLLQNSGFRVVSARKIAMAWGWGVMVFKAQA